MDNETWLVKLKMFSTTKRSPCFFYIGNGALQYTHVCDTYILLNRYICYAENKLNSHKHDAKG